jgi:hypothetical protein
MISHIPPNTIQHIAPISKAFSVPSPFSSIVAIADESIKSELEAARDFWFRWLIASTVLVFIGVVLEEAEGWTSYLKRLLPLQPITEYRLTKKLARFGWILIVAGVMGEGMFEVLVSRADARLHRFDEALLTEGKREAGDAAASAKIAHGEADAVKGIADEAREDAKDALSKAQSAQRSLAQAESDAAKAQAIASNALRRSAEAESHIESAVHQADEVSKKVDAAKNDVAVLQSLMSARHMLDVKPLERLRPLKGKMILTSSTQDDEPKNLCMAIRSVMQSTAEMNAVGGCGSLESMSPGIFVTGPDLAESTLIAKALSEAIGVTVTPVPDSPTSPLRQGNPAVLKVFVGPKGLFWFGK